MYASIYVSNGKLLTVNVNLIITIHYPTIYLIGNIKCTFHKLIFLNT